MGVWGDEDVVVSASWQYCGDIASEDDSVASPVLLCGSAQCTLKDHIYSAR